MQHEEGKACSSVECLRKVKNRSDLSISLRLMTSINGTKYFAIVVFQNGDECRHPKRNILIIEKRNVKMLTRLGFYYASRNETDMHLANRFKDLSIFLSK